MSEQQQTEDKAKAAVNSSASTSNSNNNNSIPASQSNPNTTTSISNKSPKAPLDPIVALVQHDHPQAWWELKKRFPYQTDDVELVRFLKARKYNVDRAAHMYDAHLKWKEKIWPIQKEDVAATLEKRRFYVLDHLDPQGRPVVYYNMLKYKDWGIDMEQELNALVYTMETVVKPKMLGQQPEDGENNNDAMQKKRTLAEQNYVALVDVSGIMSPPLEFLYKVNAVMEANFPEYLGRAVLFPVPPMVQALIRGMLTFVAPETRDKMAYVNDVRSLEKAANLSLDQMGPDVTALAIRGQLASGAD